MWDGLHIVKHVLDAGATIKVLHFPSLDLATPEGRGAALPGGGASARIAQRHLHSQMMEIEWAAAHRHWHDNPPVLEQRGHTLPGCLRTGLLLASELCPLGFPAAFGRIAIE
jgi:hypothetical protein